MHALLLATLLAAPAAQALPVDSIGTNAWGSHGLRLVESAIPLRSESVTVCVGVDVAEISGLFAPSDNDLLNAERLYVVWSGVPGLEVGVSDGLVTNSYSLIVDHQVQVLGDPQLRVKFGGAPFTDIPELRVGALAQWNIRSSPTSGGLVVGASGLDLGGTATWAPHPRWLLSLNVAYGLDKSQTLVADASDDERFGLALDNAVNHIRYGLGLTAVATPGPMDLFPFVEVSGDTGFGRNQMGDPLRVSAGLSGHVHRADWLDIGVGVDGRLRGTPLAGASYPGIPPWNLFAQVTGHFSYADPAAKVVPASCERDGDCGTGFVCRTARCAQVLNEVIIDAAPVVQTFSINGRVHAADGNVVRDAAVQISASGPVTVDPNTGTFTSSPIVVGEGVVQVQATAAGYKPNTVLVPKGHADDVVPVELVLTSADAGPTGTLRGALRDARTGAALPHGTVFVVETKDTFKCDEQGEFHMTLPAGTHSFIIGAPGYDAQLKHIHLNEEDVVIMNLDLRTQTHTLPKKKH